MITGLDRVPADVFVTHAGTARTESGEIVTAGGRVLSVTASRAPTWRAPAPPHMLPPT